MRETRESYAKLAEGELDGSFDLLEEELKPMSPEAASELQLTVHHHLVGAIVYALLSISKAIEETENNGL